MAFTRPELKLRWINDNEHAAVAAISQETFPAEEAYTERTITVFRTLANHIPNVLTLNGEVLGYCFTVVYNKIITIDQMAIATAYRRRGNGTFMINDTLARMPGMRRRILSVDVCETNLGAQQFLTKNKFECFQILPGDAKQGIRDRYAFKFAHKPEKFAK